MDAIDQLQQRDAAPAPPVRRGCLVTGCACKDFRLLSRRRAMFHAWLLRNRGQTATRVIAPEPGWALPLSA